MRVTLFVNHACNLRCTYCYNGKKFDRPMSLDVARRGVDMALSTAGQRIAPAQLSFFGGEPLLEFDLIQECVSYASSQARRLDRAIRYHVVSNGTRIDDDVLEFFAKHSFHVAVSLDGNKKAHDASRRYRNGRSCFAAAVRNVRTLLERDATASFKIIAVIDPGNVAFLADSFDFILGLGVRNLSMNVNYEAAWDDSNRVAFTRSLRALGDRYIEAYRSQRSFTLNVLDAKIVTHLKGGYSPRDCCDFGCEEVAVAPSGRLYPCDRLVGQDDRGDLVIGDVSKGIQTQQRDSLIAQKNEVLTECRDCALQSRCMHWCGCVNHAMTGRVGEVAGLLCWFEQRLIEEADRCASVLFKEGNPGFMDRFYIGLATRKAPKSTRP